MNHACDRIQQLMSVYRELDPAARRDVDVAVGDCSACAAAWADEQLVVSYLAMIPEIAAPSGLKGRLHEIPDRPAVPFFTEESIRLLLLLLAASALWLFMLNSGPDAHRLGDSDAEAPHEGPAAADIGVTDGFEQSSRPELIHRAIPVALVTPSIVTAHVDALSDSDHAGPPVSRTSAVNSYGDTRSPLSRSRTPDTKSGADQTPDRLGPVSGSSGRDNSRGESLAGDEPRTRDDSGPVCVTVDVRPYFDLPDDTGEYTVDCAVCGDGLPDENELERARALASALPAMQIVVEYILPSGEWEASEEVTIPAGTYSHMIALRCELFNRGDVTLRAVQAGGGALCPVGADGHEARIASTGSSATFAVPFKWTCPPTRPASPTPTTTPLPTPSPDPTSTALPLPSPTAPGTPEPLDPGPAMPTQEPSPTPTATYQPSVTPTSAWPQEGIGPAP